MPRHPAPSRNALDPAARSLQVFGLYLCATGLGLLVAPALVLAPLQLPVPQEVWIRIVGILALALALGCTDVMTARAGVPGLVRLSVWRRLGAGMAMLALTAVGIAPPAVALLAAVDLAAAAWTAWALRRSAATPLPQAGVV